MVGGEGGRGEGGMAVVPHLTHYTSSIHVTVVGL